VVVTDQRQDYGPASRLCFPAPSITRARSLPRKLRIANWPGPMAGIHSGATGA